jgi:hypothetical protein
MPAFDVIVYDYMGGNYTGSSPDKTSVGGAPFAVIQVIKGLAARGVTVAVINDYPGDTIEGGVRYISRHIAGRQKWSCKTLFQQRTGDAPDWIKRAKIVVALHDKPGWHTKTLTDRLGRERVEFVAVSKWQAGLYPLELNCQVIPNILPDIVYETRITHTSGRFIYASAASRGLDESISMWRRLQQYERVRGGSFVACAPGYDPIKSSGGDGIEILGSLTFPMLVKEMADSEGLLYCNSNPETFSYIAAIAEALGRKTHILCKYDMGAIPDTVNSKLVTRNAYQFAKDFIASYGDTSGAWTWKPKDYRSSTWMPKWAELLLLEDR